VKSSAKPAKANGSAKLNGHAAGKGKGKSKKAEASL